MMTESTHTGSHDRVSSQPSTVLDGHDYTLSVDDVAAILGKSVETVRRYARSGRLPSMRVQGDRIIEYRFRPDDLQGGQAVTHGQTGSQAGMPAKAGGYTDDRLMTASWAEQVIAPLLARIADTLQANERLTRQVVELASEKGELAGQLKVKDDLIAELRRQLPARESTPRPRSALGSLLVALARRLS